jgi:phosphopantothenoylcysteine decarboxylase/phosphopantothenate--cysteine ligase
MVLSGKKILIGISGGIAAYKICELVRLFKKGGAEVRIIMTPSSVRFVSPITLSALSGNDVLINVFPQTDLETLEKVETKTWHVHAGLWADVMLVAPATANTLAKLAAGISDNLLTATVLASRCPVVIVPSMDEDMFINEVTSSNMSRLEELGYFIITPETGELASGLFGIGRMPEPESLFDYVSRFLENFNKDLIGKKVLVTAGPTYEPIDDVRFIGNYSSGKMGFQIARAAAHRGAEVILISGPSTLRTPRNVHRVDVQTSDEMFEEVKKNFSLCHYVIMAAAIADFKPETKVAGKIKKSKQDHLIIRTSKTVDILQYIGDHKDGCKLAGFALETENELTNAGEKLRNKNLDLIVINNPMAEGAGFASDTNIVALLTRSGEITQLPKMSKYEVGNAILSKLTEI